MDFSEFKSSLLNGIKNNNKNSIKLINNNKILVQEYFNYNNLNYVREFIDSLYFPILAEKKKFKVIENVLKNPSMIVVLAEFRKSNILIKICEEGSNKKAIEWLLTMNMDLSVQDEKGRTAFMYAVHHWNLESVIDNFLNANGNHLNLADNDGNTALFHASHSTPIFKKLLKSNKFDYNHINNDHENILIYCAKHDTIRSFDILMSKPDIDFNIINNVGKNLAMMLVENTRYSELKILFETKNIDVNYQNKFGENLVSLYFNKYEQQVEGELGKNYITEFNYYKVKNFANTLKTLISIGCDFNCPIDGDGNTPAMAFMFMEDYVSLQYLLENCDIDLSIKNKYGIDAAYLSLFLKSEVFDNLDYNKQNILKHISYKSLKQTISKNKGFNFNYMDNNNNNLVIYGLVHNDPLTMDYIDSISPKLLFEKNNKNENAIIVATKLGRDEELEYILSKISGDKEREIHVNTQDYIGNTALHYAVLLKNKYAINLLMNNKANPNIQNNSELSPLTLSENIEENIITDLLLNPIPVSEMKKQIEKQKYFSAVKIKSSNEKINTYIINYRINASQEDYNNFLKNDVISCYSPSPFNSTVQQWMMEVLYPNAGSKIYVFHPLNKAPSDMVKDIIKAQKSYTTTKM